MSRRSRVAFAVGAALVVVAACNKVPVTGRPQYNLVPDSIMRGLGKSSYRDALSSEKLEKQGEEAELLKKVGNRIAKVANQPDYDWSYSLVDDDDTINAWCLPGGYIAFYTGILPVLENEAGMAFVMGHEVGHAVAHHSAERLTQQLTLVGGLVGLELFLANETELEPKERAVVLAALGIGAEVGVLLPFSRTHENEADVIGLMYMARAGYPPGESTQLWDRMEKQAPSNVPTFLSTHPSNEARKDNLREWMPQARKKYERNKLAYDTQKTLWGAGSGGAAAVRGD